MQSEDADGRFTAPVGVFILLSRGHCSDALELNTISGVHSAGGLSGGSDKNGAIQLDSLITAAANLLATGDPIGALNHVALRNDPPALALRGIAIAQLGDLERARSLLKRAAAVFGPREATDRARCIVAEAEIALVSRDLLWPAEPLESARAILEASGDLTNAGYARCLEARRLLLLGRLDEAEDVLGDLDTTSQSPASQTARELIVAGIAMRRVRTRPARQALSRADRAARVANIPALTAEVQEAWRFLEAPAARLIGEGAESPVRLSEVETLFSSGALIIDALRNNVRETGRVVALGSRPVLFSLARALAEVWPDDLSREVLLMRAFRARHSDESHRVRLRVEIGRLRRELRGMATVTATPHGFALRPLQASRVVILASPFEERHADVLALLADGEAWSSSALALALGSSQRSVQRALDNLLSNGKVQFFGRGRARRWIVPSVPGFPTALLLPAPTPGG